MSIPHHQTPKAKATRKAYLQRPEVKKRLAEYFKEYRKKNPERCKQWQQNYEQTESCKSRRRAYKTEEKYLKQQGQYRKEYQSSPKYITNQHAYQLRKAVKFINRYQDSWAVHLKHGWPDSRLCEQKIGSDHLQVEQILRFIWMGQIYGLQVEIETAQTREDLYTGTYQVFSSWDNYIIALAGDRIPELQTIIDELKGLIQKYNNGELHNKASGPIQVFDSGNNLIVNQTLTGIQTPVTDYSQGSLSVSAAAAAVPLPVSPANFIYMQNIGTATAVVSWVPQGGAGAIVQNLTVSSAAMVIQAGSAGNTGVTAITVSCAAATTLSYLLGG